MSAQSVEITPIASVPDQPAVTGSERLWLLSQDANTDQFPYQPTDIVTHDLTACKPQIGAEETDYLMQRGRIVAKIAANRSLFEVVTYECMYGDSDIVSPSPQLLMAEHATLKAELQVVDLRRTDVEHGTYLAARKKELTDRFGALESVPEVIGRVLSTELQRAANGFHDLLETKRQELAEQIRLEERTELASRASRIFVGIGVEPTALGVPVESIIAVMQRLEIVLPAIPTKLGTPSKFPEQLAAHLAGFRPGEIGELTSATTFALPMFCKSLAALLKRGDITPAMIELALTKRGADERADLRVLLPAPSPKIIVQPLRREPRTRRFEVELFDDAETDGEVIVVKPKVDPNMLDLDVAATGRDPVRAYLNEAGKTPLLKPEEEVALAKEIEAGLFAQELLYDPKRLARQLRTLRPDKNQAALKAELAELVRRGDEARKHFQKANLLWVVTNAKRYTGRGLAFLDLIQEGNLGLYRAVQKFDFMKGYKFSTYSKWWIDQAISRALADQARAIRVPVHAVEKMNKMNRVGREFLAKHNREATDEELAAAAEMPLDEVKDFKAFMRQEPSSLEKLVGDGDSEVGDFIPDTRAEDPASVVVRMETKERQRTALGGMLQALPAMEARVLCLRFGLLDYAPMSSGEIGEIVGCSASEVTGIGKRAVQRLRQIYGDSSLRQLIA